MRDSNVPALWDHFIAAKRAFARETSLSFSTFSFNKSVFHLFFLSPMPRINCSLATGSFETLAEAHQLVVAGSCFSSALAQAAWSRLACQLIEV
jgi:hypothetical protein